ncbi:MAG: helix-turn-helix domain-containing protein [bacterium]|nr:helix-turn-helix domain-containing protein [bacterium]
MKTAGQILSLARKSKKLEIEDVSRITRIRPNFLLLVEADDYSQLPSGTVARGFIRNYSEFLGLDPINVLAAFRRDFVENRLGQIVPRSLADPVSSRVFWTPRTTLISVVAMVFTVFIGYLGYQYRVLTGPPQLQLVQPVDGQTVTENTVLVSGETDPEATISVGDHLVALDKGGEFSFRASLIEGENQISVTATSKSGKTTTLTRKVIMVR